eukprot:3890240-Amphidinium_carterae.1
MCWHEGLEEAEFKRNAMNCLLQHYLHGDNAPAVVEPAILIGGQTTSRWIVAYVQYHLYDTCQEGSTVRGSLSVPAGVVARPGRILPGFGTG